MNSIKEKFDEFISQYPIFEYRVLDTGDIKVQSRVRTICKQECERYGSTWACPPAVGELSECEKKIRSYPKAVFFSSVAEVSDIMNMKEMLSTRMEHEALTEKVRDFWRERAMRPLRFPRNPVTSVNAVPIWTENHAVFRSICIHVWKAMAW